MPLNGKATPVSRPSWMKDATSTTTPAPTPATSSRPSWARKTPEAKKEDGTASSTVTSIAPKDATPKKDITVKLQSREIKVPQMVEKTRVITPILKKTEQKPEPKQEPKIVNVKAVSKIEPKGTSKSPDWDVDSSEEDDSSYEEDSGEEEEESEEEESEEVVVKTPFGNLKKTSTTPEKKAESKERSTSPDHTFKKPELKKVITRQKSETKERSASPEPKFIKPNLRKVPSSLRTKEPVAREKLPTVELKKTPLKAEPETSSRKMSEQFPHKPSILRAESNKKIPLPPPPPPPPPPPGLKPPSDFEKKPISQKQREVLEKLKTRPRRRPDWSEMMKEVEEVKAGTKKLRKVQCNDRSSPIIACKSVTKLQGQFIFETEKATALDQLLNQIQGGIKLKTVKTNDRSRPVLDGLRKFRRQMTIEEQIIKSESKAFLASAASEPNEDDENDELDELDDIDKVRDDLQSTKQMLALELRNKEAQERENKRLMSKIANLEAELERERIRAGNAGADVKPAYESTPVSNPHDEVLIQSLKQDAEDAQKTSKMLEKKYHDAAELLDTSQKEVEEQKRIIANLEKKLQVGGIVVDSRRQSEVPQQKESSPEMEIVMSEEEDDETDEQKAERAARRVKREVDMLVAKLVRLKEKEITAKSERKSMRDAMRKNQQILKVEKKKYKKLQKEVEKMAALMKEVENEDEESEDKSEDEEESEEESEQESEESESEESDSETESQSEDEDADDESKKLNLEPRIKRHDGRLSSLKKGNYLVEANVERLKDEIKDHKEKCQALQTDLDSVIALC
ncbi:unnamed protein product [Diamesa serratosioi]